MTNLSKMKKQVPLRMFGEEWDRLKARLVIDKLSYQKLGDILFRAYVDGNKEIMKLVKKNEDEKDGKKRRYNSFTGMEKEDLLMYLEKQSPITELDRITKEIEEEDDE